MASAPRPVSGDLATTAFVESSHLFKSVDPDARRDLLQIATLLDFGPGEVVPADSDEVFYLVRDGSASVLVPGRDGPVEIAQLPRGAFFGEGRVLGGAVRGHRGDGRLVPRAGDRRDRGAVSEGEEAPRGRPRRAGA